MKERMPSRREVPALPELASESIDEIASDVRGLREELAEMPNEEHVKRLELILDKLSGVRKKVLTEEKHARTDPLTGASNLRVFNERLTTSITEQKESGTHMYVFAIDLDNFKKINDTLGHAAGDIYLKNISRSIQASLRKTDTFTRKGGDEFSILMPGLSPAYIEVVKKRLLDAVRKGDEDSRNEVMRTLNHASFSDKPIQVTGSIGYVYHDGQESADALHARADRHLYDAKNRGRDQIVGDERQKLLPYYPANTNNPDSSAAA